MNQSETINTNYWQSLGWELTSFNVPGIVIDVAPPDPYSDTREWPPSEGLQYFEVHDEALEDAEDLQDALITEHRYIGREVTMSELRARLHQRRPVVPDPSPAEVIRELRDEP